MKYPACCKKLQFLMWIRRCFLCLNSACTCICLCVCVCVCSAPLSVSPGLQLAAWDPLRFQPGVAVHMHLYLHICVCEGEKQTDRTLLWAPCCHWGKPIMGHARVSGTPPTKIIQTHSFPLICMDATCKAPSLRFPPATWRPGQVLPPQLDMKLDSCCLHIF